MVTTELTAQEYSRLSKRTAPRSPVLTDCLKAFFIGGAICTIGQLIVFGAEALGTHQKTASLVCSVSLIALSVLLTGLGLYDKIAKHAGAGTLVPITGFANAIAAPAIEFKTEGFVLGIAANMFAIAGPVITYATAAGVVYGVIYWICQMLK
ncbi:MAG: stage V sporulation protein AC [Clostridia bacterium]|nr:stage V sporulation protein AC [Clostridia bacterium]